MHDIICPHCGENFIARDVVFDFSQYILPNYEPIKQLGFKYYVDEEDMLTHHDEANEVPLTIDDPLGPGRQGPFYQYAVTNDMIFTYITSKAGLDTAAFSAKLTAISKDISKTVRGGYDAGTVSDVRKIYNSCFSFASRDVQEFDINSAEMSLVIDMLLHINDNPYEKITVGVRMFCEKKNPDKPDYRVPDILFVLNDENGQVERNYKCCRCCGSKFPREFGYYKMVPVTLLGSHYSGKTSFLLALLWCIRNRPPFNGANSKFRVTTLTDDPDLEAFDKNIEKYERGLPPAKTDFKDVPILSLLINNIIYTFTDWPGEAFIGKGSNKLTFAYDSRRIIRKSRHFICCLDPKQVAHDVSGDSQDREENVDFTENQLLQSFEQHINLAAPLNKVRSIIFLVNKFDRFDNYPGSEDIKNSIRNKTESDIYDNNCNWNELNWKDITQKTREFLMIQMPTLTSKAQTAYQINNIRFIPAAPYGQSVNEGNSGVINMGYLVGLPLLNILKNDGTI